MRSGLRLRGSGGRNRESCGVLRREVFQSERPKSSRRSSATHDSLSSSDTSSRLPVGLNSEEAGGDELETGLLNVGVDRPVRRSGAGSRKTLRSGEG